MNTVENTGVADDVQDRAAAAAAAEAKAKKKYLRKLNNSSGLPRNMQKSAYIFVAILLIPAYYGIFRDIVTKSFNILLAFSEGQLFKDPWSFANFELFWKAIGTSTGELSIALSNTLKYYCVGLIQAFCSYFIAYVLYKKIPGSKIFRFTFFLPYIISSVITVAIFKNLIAEMGPIWTLWKNLTGQEYKAPLAYPETATNTIILYTFLTGFGTTYLIYMGAMNRVPQEVLESAKLDGCTVWREFWSILFPLTWGTFSTFLLLSSTSIFTSSGPILYFTNGAAKTQTLGFWLFNQVRNGYYNYPSAVGLVFTGLTIPIVVFIRLLMKKLNAGVDY